MASPSEPSPGGAPAETAETAARSETRTWLGDKVFLEAKRDQLIQEVQKTRLQGAGANPGLVTSLLRLGTVRSWLGQLKQAESDLQEALTELRKVNGDGPHPDTVAILYALSDVKLKQNDLESATRSINQALEIQKTLPGDSAAEATRRLEGMVSKIRSAASAPKEFLENKLSQWPKEGELIKQQLRNMSERDGGAWLFARPFIALVKAIEQVAFRGSTRGCDNNEEIVKEVGELLETATRPVEARPQNVLDALNEDFEVVPLPEDAAEGQAAQAQLDEPPEPARQLFEELQQDLTVLLIRLDPFYSGFRPSLEQVECGFRTEEDVRGGIDVAIDNEQVAQSQRAGDAPALNGYLAAAQNACEPSSEEAASVEVAPAEMAACPDEAPESAAKTEEPPLGSSEPEAEADA